MQKMNIFAPKLDLEIFGVDIFDGDWIEANVWL